jgi:hypothetical protein
MASSSERVLTKSYLNSQNVEIGKFSVLCRDTSVYNATASGGPGGFRVPTGANDGPLAGVATDSIVPFGFSVYQGGTYLGGGSVPVTGTSWPAGATPSVGNGLALALAVSGIYRCIAAGVITVGNPLKIADAYGRVTPVGTGNVSGTLIYEVGIAETSATNANDIVRVRLTLQDRPATTSEN